MAKIGGQTWNPFSRNDIQYAKVPPLPLQDIDLFSVHSALEAITLAVEAGNLDTDTWPEQLFASREVFDKFCSALGAYDEDFRIIDRWWCALADLVDELDEAGFIHSNDIAARIEETCAAVVERRAQWQAKKPAKAKLKKVA